MVPHGTARYDTVRHGRARCVSFFLLEEEDTNNIVGRKIPLIYSI